MARSTIDFGIDLGTTNSSIAVWDGRASNMVRNIEGDEITPSAVYIEVVEGQERIFVGDFAKERVEYDPDNAVCEFKLKMGTNEDYHFVKSDRRMKPYELSAEVLKSLRTDVQRSLDEVVENAVITVPAGFEQPQCEATNEAAKLAGFRVHPLLQEPVAAAMAYGFQSEKDRVFWLVYDFGGGTFDVSLINMRDGVIQVVNHAGDNHLGGKLIDWAIVNEVLLPQLLGRCRLTDFRRGNPRHAQAFAKLKYHTEKAKIRLSRVDSAPIRIDYLCDDDNGQRVGFDYMLSRAEVERCSEPFIRRSINLSLKMLANSSLSPADIEQLILVGGPTKMPYLRDRLADGNDGLGITLEFKEDALTVVAKGAAIFAGSQRVSGELAVPTQVGEYAIDLEYEPMGPDPEPLVGGRVIGAEEENLSGFTIEFVNTTIQPRWRSGKVGLAPNGGFMATLWAEKGEQNVFTIELASPKGVAQKVSPDSFTYVVGNQPVKDPMLIHPIGVALANNEMEWFLEKGNPLPQRRRIILRTAVEVRKGQTKNVIRIPVMEGDNNRADRNRRIGMLEIREAAIKRDVPAGSEVEVTIDMDRSRLLRVKAYIPILDEEYENVVDTSSYGSHDPDDLAKQVEREKQRLEKLRTKVEETRDQKAREILRKIDSERMLYDLDAALEAAKIDQEAADTCDKRLLDLKVALDQIEDALAWPETVREAENLISNGRDLVNEKGDAHHREEYGRHEQSIRTAIDSHDPDLLRQRIDDLHTFLFRLLDEKGILQILFFQNICNERDKMRDQSQADQLIEQGHRAINNNDYAGLKEVNRQLAALLPSPPPPPDLSTVMR